MKAVVIDPMSCILCGACAGVCPEGAFTENDVSFQVDQDLCVGCRTCVDACPQEIISME